MTGSTCGCADSMAKRLDRDQFADVQQATRQHLRQHRCGAYTFEDGPALTALSVWKRPQRVLELGTALGYTACCLAQGCASTRVDTIEGDATHVELAREQIARHGLTDRITVHHGQFDKILGQLEMGYDLAFFDGFEPPPAIIARIRDVLAIGGMLVCSNLQLGRGSAARQLARELDDARRWQTLSSIEHGRTAVRLKLNA